MDNQIVMTRELSDKGQYEYTFTFMDLTFSGREPDEAYAHVETCAKLVRNAQVIGGFQPFEASPLFRAYATQ